jgi:pimeloyl-ACP methyl ester carboxylesterase
MLRANRSRDDALLRGFEPRFADTKAVRMRYFIGGEGRSVVLVHGLSGAAANWVHVAPRLAARHRVLVPDLPGHGGSGALPAAPNLDAFAERVRRVAELEGMLPTTVVGHSLGGLVALRWAIRRPQDVLGLVLAGAAGIGSGTRWAEFWISLFGITRPAKVIAPLRHAIGRHASLRRAIFTRWQVADPLSLAADAIEHLLVAPPLHADVISAGEALVAGDPRPDLARIRCPALVVWGARDLQVRIDDAFEYARRLRAPLRTIADCGHLLIAERPDACTAAIEAFLDGQTGFGSSTNSHSRAKRSARR